MPRGTEVTVRSSSGVVAGDTRINFAVHQVRANAQGARQDFEEMIGQLVKAVRPGVTRAVAAHPGDWGIDVFVGDLGGLVTVWQSKYFVPVVNKTHQNQIRESFKSAVENAAKEGFSLTRWILCVPASMDGPTTKWWDGWKKRQERDKGIAIELWDETELRRLLISPVAEHVRQHYYEPAGETARPAAPAVYLTRPMLLPRDVPAFTGREPELARIAALAECGSVVVSAVDGTAGVGKTALAIHAAHGLLASFPDGHLYADLRGYTAGQASAEPGEILDMFLRSLGIPAHDLPPGLDDKSALLRNVLASRRVIMVLDNAASETQVSPLLPGAGFSLVLITSRRALAGLEVNERVSLGMLSDDEAMALLAKLIGQERAGSDPAALRRICELCGFLPLALRIAGQLLATHPAWSISHLSERIADERSRLDKIAAGDLQVRSAFSVSYDQLPPCDAQMFRLLGLHPGPDLDALAAASLTDLTPDAAETILERLAEDHLIIEENAGRYRMHELLRLFAREICEVQEDEAARREAQERMVCHYSSGAMVLNEFLDPEHTSPKIDIRLLLDVFERDRQSMLAVLHQAISDRNDHFPEMRENLIPLLIRTRHLDDLIAIEAATLAAARSAGDREIEADALAGLGAAYGMNRQLNEARTCINDALFIYTELQNRSGEMWALNDLGNVYHQLRELDGAVNCYQKALTLSRDIRDSAAERAALTNLGSINRELRFFDEAAANLHAALVICQGSGDPQGMAQTLNNLGNVHREQGKPAEAEIDNRGALILFREIGDRHGEAQALINIGNSEQELGRYSSALAFYKGALDIFQELSDRHSEALALRSLGMTYRELGKFDDSLECWSTAIDIAREVDDTDIVHSIEFLMRMPRS